MALAIAAAVMTRPRPVTLGTRRAALTIGARPTMIAMCPAIAMRRRGTAIAFGPGRTALTLAARTGNALFVRQRIVHRASGCARGPFLADMLVARVLVAALAVA